MMKAQNLRRRENCKLQDQQCGVGKLKWLVFALITIVTSTSAYAVPLSVSSNIGDEVLLGHSTYSGLFDIRSELTPSTNYNYPLDINSVTFEFTFSDDPSDPVRSSLTSRDRPGLYTHGEGENYYNNTRTRLYLEGNESATLAFGAQSESGNTTLSTTTVINDYFVGRRSGRNLFDRTITTTTGYTGDFTISGILNAASVLDLATDGLLDFSLLVVGDLILKSSTLSFNVTPNPSLITHVPEPSTLSLLAGVGMLGLVVRRKNKVLKPVCQA